MGCENNCVNEHRIKSLEEDFKDLKTKNSSDHKEFFTRIEDTEKDMVESRGDRKHMREKLDKIDINVETIMNKPAKRYESIITQILSAVIGVLVGFILSGILPV